MVGQQLRDRQPAEEMQSEEENLAAAQTYSLIRAPTTAPGRRHVDRKCDDEAHDGPKRPLPVEPPQNRRVPEQGGGQKDKASERPQKGSEHPGEPAGEEPQEHNNESRSCERNDYEKTWHFEYLLSRMRFYFFASLYFIIPHMASANGPMVLSRIAIFLIIAPVSYSTQRFG